MGQRAPGGNPSDLGSWTLQARFVRAQTPETEAYLRALVPPTGDRQPIPAGAYNVGAQPRAREDDVDSHPPRARVHLGQGSWITLRAARVVGSDQTDPDIAVTLELTSTNERMALFSLAHGLSKREAQIVAACARGTDTRGLAQELFVSENTVQDHFKSIFAKTKTRTRGELLAIARIARRNKRGRPRWSAPQTRRRMGSRPA